MKRKLLLSLSCLVLAPFLAEIGARLVLRLRGEPYDARDARARIETIYASLDQESLPRPRTARSARPRGGVIDTSRFRLHPFYGWETPPGNERVSQDVELFRAGVADDEYVIVVVGGSVSGLFSDPEVGAPDVLQAELAKDPRFAGRTVRILGHGRGAFKQPQQVHVLSWLFALGVAPDAVVNIDGFNEVAIACQNRKFDAHPLLPSSPQWQPLARASATGEAVTLLAELVDRRAELADIAETALRRSYHRSALLGRWTLSRLYAANREVYAAQNEYVRASSTGARKLGPLAPTFDGEAAEAVELAVRCWREASLDLDAICERRSIQYLHVLQPTMHDPGAKILTAEEIETGKIDAEWKIGVERGYPRLREEGAVLREKGVAFLDASRVFQDVDRTLYYDCCHFRRDGNEMLARAIARALLDALPPP